MFRIYRIRIFLMLVKVDNGSNTCMDTKNLYLEIYGSWWSIQASCGLEPFMKRYSFFFSSFFGSLHSARLIFSSLTTSASPLSSSSPTELSNNTILPAIILRAVFCLNASYEKRKKKKRKVKEGEIKMLEACILKMILHAFLFL